MFSGSIIISIVINIHTWLELDISECFSTEFNQKVRTITLTALKSNEVYNIITKCILYTLLMFVIPFVTLIIVNWRIVVTLKQSTRMRNRLSSTRYSQARMIHNFRLLKNANHSKIFGKFARLRFKHLRNSGHSKSGSVRDRSVTLMLLAIVAIFLCCNSLAFCNNIYEIVRDARAHIEQNSTQPTMSSTVENETETLEQNQDVFDFSVELSNILISLNSASSIFVYLVFSSKYRSIVKNWFGLEEKNTTNDVAITTAMVAERALELSFLPDEASERLVKPEYEAASSVPLNTLEDKGEVKRPVDIASTRGGFRRESKGR
uniref:G_PROTEIN_RECEP_F1_2 domain-containing protein n=1 Tax=Angiostrongylus cantonensis TaxID=6313 RepID=A0A0K0D0Z0_ANGCA